MPYKSIDELPDRIKNHLPKHAQEIYLEAYNHALIEYKDPSKRKLGGDLEATSARVAWSAVKHKYEKGEDGNWHEI